MIGATTLDIKRGRASKTYESSADNHDMLCVLEPLFQQQGFVEKPQVEDAVEIRAFDWEHAIARADGEDEFAVGNTIA